MPVRARIYICMNILIKCRTGGKRKPNGAGETREKEILSDNKIIYFLKTVKTIDGTADKYYNAVSTRGE